MIAQQEGPSRRLEGQPEPQCFWPIPSHRLLFLPNGIDLLDDPNRNPKDKGTRYEKQCFLTLTQSHAYGERFIIGPNLLNHLLEAPITKYHVKPDALRIGRTRSGGCKVAKVYEFKSGEIDSRRKVDGFSELFYTLRANPDFLPYILRETIGEHINVPDVIHVPPDNQIKIIFMVSRKQISNGTFYPRIGGSPVNYVALPLKKLNNK